MSSKKAVSKKSSDQKVPSVETNPFSVSLNLGFKFIKCHVDLSLNEDYLERRRNEAVRSKCSNHECNRHS